MPVQFREKSSGFECVELVHKAVPDVDRDGVDCSTRLFGKRLTAPIIIAAITGGTPEGKAINQKLARACENLGLGFGVGSQRAAIEDPSLAGTFDVRSSCPNSLLLGNLGLVQFCEGYGVAQAKKAVDMIKADGLCVHLNPAQEAVQPEGDTGFKGGLAKLRELCTGVKFPVIAKECGCGISRRTAVDLVKAGVSGIDVGGAGGTSWVGVEYFRSGSPLAQTFWDWGIPTAASVVYCSGKGVPVIATGGVRSGLDAAKAIALGADAVGVALPALLSYPDRVEEFLSRFVQELRVAMFLTGCGSLKELRSCQKLVLDPLKAWLS